MKVLERLVQAFVVLTLVLSPVSLQAMDTRGSAQNQPGSEVSSERNSVRGLDSAPLSSGQFSWSFDWSSPTLGDVDFEVVNPILQKLLDPILEKDDLVILAFPKFDESASSLEKEIIKYDVSTKWINPPWKSEGDFTSINVESTYRSDRTEGRSGIWIEAEVEVSTDALGLIRHASGLALQGDQWIPKSNWRTAWKGLMKEFSKVSTMEELRILLRKSQAYVVRDIDEKIAESLILLEQLLDEVEHLNLLNDISHSHELQIITLKQRMKELRQQRDAFARNHASMKAQEEITYLAKSPVDLVPEKHRGRVTLEPVVMHLRSRSIEISSRGFVSLSPLKLNKLKSEFGALLRELQNHNAEEQQNVQKLYRDALVAIKKAIREGKI